jgi:hypothetical protein
LDFGFAKTFAHSGGSRERVLRGDPFARRAVRGFV